MKIVCKLHYEAYDSDKSCKWCDGIIEDARDKVVKSIEAHEQASIRKDWHVVDLDDSKPEDDTVPMYRRLVAGQGIQITTPDGDTPIITIASTQLDDMDDDDYVWNFGDDKGFDANGMYID